MWFQPSAMEVLKSAGSGFPKLKTARHKSIEVHKDAFTSMYTVPNFSVCQAEVSFRDQGCTESWSRASWRSRLRIVPEKAHQLERESVDMDRRPTRIINITTILPRQGSVRDWFDNYRSSAPRELCETLQELFFCTSLYLAADTRHPAQRVSVDAGTGECQSSRAQAVEACRISAQVP